VQNLEGLDFGPFRVERLLGHGGFAAVYRVRRKTSGEVYTIKVLAPEYARHPDISSMFAREAQLVTELRHPNLPTALTVDRLYGRPYIVFAYDEGTTLETFLEDAGDGDMMTVVHALLGTAQAIDYLHDRGVLHRDIKPGNILLTTSGAAKLLDFGLAAHVSERTFLHDTAAAGTPAYLAPELREGGVPSPASDLYSFGVVTDVALRRFKQLQAAFGDGPAAIADALSPDPARRSARATGWFARVMRELDLG
jgi:eukaryotic-like serine/threonine-protein kinase